MRKHIPKHEQLHIYAYAVPPYKEILAVLLEPSILSWRLYKSIFYFKTTVSVQVNFLVAVTDEQNSRFCMCVLYSVCLMHCVGNVR